MKKLSREDRMPKNEFVSILLPTYNRANLLEQCINSVLMQSYPHWELIICDDGSTDDTSRVAQNFVEKYPRILYYRNSTRQGLPKNRNIAISISHYDLIFFIEDDLILESNCLEILVNTFKELESKVHIGAIAPRLIDNRENKHYFDKKKMHDACVIDKKTGRIYSNFGLESNVLQECPTLHACSLITKRVFEEVGGYEEDRYRGAAYFREETDFYFRATQKNYKLYFQPNAITYHKHVDFGGCRVNNNLTEKYYCIRNNIFLMLRFHGLKSIYMILFYILSVFFRIFKNILKMLGKL